MTALDEFNAALSRYIGFSKKGQGPIVEDRARKVRLELYRQFRQIAKTPAALRAEIVGKGYAVKRREKSAVAQQALRSAYGLRGALSYEDRSISTDLEIRLRTRSLRYLSVAWLFREWKARHGGQRGTYRAVDGAQKIIGEAIVNTADGTEAPAVDLTSFLLGVAVQNQKRRLVDEALRGQAEDMAGYVARKHQEQLQAAFNKTFGATLAARI